MKVLIIGNGLAGVTTASSLVNLDDSIEVEMFSEEKYPYYSRVRLVDYIVGNVSFDELIVYNQSWYDARGITLHLNSKINEINTAKQKITVIEGDKKPVEYSYDKLVIASGSKPIIPDIPGKEKNGWHQLRTIEDANEIKEHLKQAERITILGSGLLGLELAHKFRSGAMSRETSVLEQEPIVAPVYLDKQGSTIFMNLLERAGIKIHVKTEVTELVGEDSIEGCRLADKTIHKGDMVIFACGVEPNTAFLEGTPIKIIDGIVVDKNLQTSVKNVYAVGDCCEFNAFIYGINPAAIEQAKLCAQNIVEPGSEEYKGTMISVSFSGFNTRLVSLGRVNEYLIDQHEWEDIHSYYKVDPTLGVYKKIFIKDNRVIGAILVGDVSQQAEIRKLILEKIDVTEFYESILQDGFSLREWV